MEEQGLCALCKHFKLIASGREFEGIADTEYIVFRCEVFGVTGREDYLMKPPEAIVSIADRHAACTHWERW